MLVTKCDLCKREIEDREGVVTAGVGIPQKQPYFPKALRTDGGSSLASQDVWTIAIQSQQGTATDAVVLFARQE